MTRRAYAPTILKSASLSTEFGLSYATRLFGEEAIASLPVLKTGPNKGKPKGHICWLRTTGSGYHPNIGGGVGPGVTVRAWISNSPMSGEHAAIRGMWIGRVQTLCGSACLLGPKARESWTAEWNNERAQQSLNA